MCKKMPFSYPIFFSFENLPTVGGRGGGGGSKPTPSPRSVASLPRFAPAPPVEKSWLYQCVCVCVCVCRHGVTGGGGGIPPNDSFCLSAQRLLVMYVSYW